MTATGGLTGEPNKGLLLTRAGCEGPSHSACASQLGISIVVAQQNSKVLASTRGV